MYRLFICLNRTHKRSTRAEIQITTREQKIEAKQYGFGTYKIFMDAEGNGKEIFFKIVIRYRVKKNF